MGDELPLSGRRALVTGAASDIGAAVCAALCGKGARVIATDLPGERLTALAAAASAGGWSAELCAADITDPSAVATLCEEPVAILASVAGFAHVERFHDGDPDTWERMWQVNLRAPMLLTRALLPAMTAQRWGRLVYVASDSARAGAGGEAVYAATKAGLFGFAKSVAREVAAAGVTANVVCPGVIDTARSRTILAGHAGMGDALRRSIPARAFGTPEDVAGAVAYLCSPAAGYVTGQTLSVNGGITMG